LDTPCHRGSRTWRPETAPPLTDGSGPERGRRARAGRRETGPGVAPSHRGGCYNAWMAAEGLGV
jgi:hypothetical protein